MVLCYFINPPNSQASVVFTMILADMAPKDPLMFQGYTKLYEYKIRRQVLGALSLEKRLN